MSEKRWYLYKSALTVPTQFVAMQDSRGMTYAQATKFAEEISKAFAEVDKLQADNADLRRQVTDLQAQLETVDAIVTSGPRNLDWTGVTP